MGKSAMIKVRLQIGEGGIHDTMEKWGLVYISSDHRFAAPFKELEKTTYPEEEGEHISNKAVANAFDYKAEFLVKADGSLDNANKVIANFNSQLINQVGESISQVNQVTFYNDYKKVKIVGTPSPIVEATDFWRDAKGIQHDVVKVELVIRVSKPSLCDFNLVSD
jgi:hypothetical protein